MARAAKTTKTVNSREQGGSPASQAAKKPMRPLSLLFGPAASSNNSESIKQPAKVRTNGSERASKRARTSPAIPATTSTEAIELSSDEELLLDDANDEVEDVKIDVERDFAVKSDGDQTEDAADDLIVTGYQAGPSKILENKLDVRGSINKTDGSAKPAIQSTATASRVKGKQRAEDNFIPELEIADTQESALWSDKYAPKDIASLCIHKKKLQDVQAWLREAWAGGTTSKYRRVLVLSGPAGSGKTAVIRALSKDMSFNVTEYKTSEGFTDSGARHLPAFLARGAVSSALTFGKLTASDQIAVPAEAKSEGDGPPMQKIRGPATLTAFAKPSTSKLPAAPLRRNLLLIEDLPNIFTSPSTRTAFQSAVLDFARNKRLSNNAVVPDANVPVVIIVSESLVRPGQNQGELAVNRYQGSGEQSISVRTVISYDVMRTGAATEIKFNPIAPTFMKKTLAVVADMEWKTAKQSKPSAEDLLIVTQASDGDIRSALNTLQFALGSGQAVEADMGQRGKKRRSNAKVKSDGSKVPANRALLQIASTKEPSLFLFHALGKVLFNKRWGENREEDEKNQRCPPADDSEMPEHLSKWKRRPSKVDVNALFADAPVDADLFTTYLHQNYPPFCDDVGNCSNMMEYISISDALMRMEGDTFTRHALTSHYSFQTCVRGALLALPTPVVRRGQKMYKSEIWEVQKRTKDNSDRISDWVTLRQRTIAVEEDLSDLLPARRSIVTEILPLYGLKQCPNGLPPAIFPKNDRFRRPVETVKAASRASTRIDKLDQALLEVALFPPVAVVASKSALNDREVVDGESEDEKPTTPAVKVEQSDAFEAELEDHLAVDKLYLSDDDIDSF